jgi:hypothetical protein
MALQRCAAVPESEMQRDEFNPVTLLARILQIYSSYQSRAEDNTGVGRDAALFTLFQHTITIATNLEALFRLCNPEIHAGRIRCVAIHILACMSTG